MSTYEEAYENINSKLINTENNVKFSTNQKLEYINQELSHKLKLKESEISQIKQLYENELKMKNEIYSENILHLTKTHQDEIRKLRIDYENKMDELIKKSEEEKIELLRKATKNEKDLLLKNSKSELNEKVELIDFQKKYLNEMKDLQKTFEDFKLKTYEEFKAYKKQKDEANARTNFYKENYEKLKEDLQYNENMYNNLKDKFGNIKNILKTNEMLKNQLDISKSEINFLKTKIAKLENALNYPIQENSKDKNEGLILQNLQIDNMNYLTEGVNESYKNNLYSNKSTDIVNFETKYNRHGYGGNFIKSELDLFSPPSTTKQITTDHCLSNNNQNLKSVQKNFNIEFSKNNYPSLEENLYKAIDLKKAHQKIKKMEDCLKSMNEENENLKSKLGSVINNLSNINTPSYTSHSNQTVATNQNPPTIENLNYHLTTVNIPSGNNTNTNSYVNSKKNFKKKKTYSTQIFEDCNKLKLNTSNLSENCFSKINEEVVSQPPSHRKITRELTPTLVESNPNLIDKKSNVYTLKSVRDQEKKNDEDKRKLKNKSFVSLNIKNEEVDGEDTIDDNIIEFPLQLKIKGKIKKITANTAKSNTKNSSADNKMK